MSPAEAALDRLFRALLDAGQRAGRTKRPEVRDAFFSAAAMVAKEALSVGVQVSEEAKHGPQA